ncbi:MAG: ATP-binding protein [Acidimicrobiales bacterium]
MTKSFSGRAYGEQLHTEIGSNAPVMFRLPPELHSVSEARAKLGEAARSWGCPSELVEDARLVLSELMSNGVLHARTELEVALSQRDGGGLRIEVHDASAAPVLPPLDVAKAAANLLDDPLPSELLAELLTEPAATGRGLAVVSALSRTWGWSSDRAGGKVVWAELASGPGEQAAPERGNGGRPGYPIRPVRLIAVPVRLLKVSEDHFDDLFRELQMAHMAKPVAGTPAPVQAVAPPGRPPGGLAGGGDALLVTGKLASLAEDVRSRVAWMREPVRRAIWEATRRGDRLLDINIVADAGMPPVLEAMEDLLAQAAKAAKAGLLLTEPPSAEVVGWRRWLRQEMEGQISGRPPRACPFPVVPVHETEGSPARSRLDAARREAVAQLRSLLAKGSSPRRQGRGPGPGYAGDKTVTEGLARVVEYVGARRAVLCMLAGDNETVTFGASWVFPRPWPSTGRATPSRLTCQGRRR